MKNIIAPFVFRNIHKSDNLEAAVQRKLKFGSSNGISEKTMGKLIVRAQSTDTASITNVLNSLKRETSTAARQMADVIRLVTTAGDKEAGVAAPHRTVSGEASHTLSPKAQFADTSPQTGGELPTGLPRSQASVPTPQPTPTYGANVPAAPPPPPPGLLVPSPAKHATLAQQITAVKLRQVEKQEVMPTDTRDTAEKRVGTVQDELAAMLQKGGPSLRKPAYHQRAASVEEPKTELELAFAKRSKSE